MKIYVCEFIPRGDYTGPGYCREEFRTASVVSVHARQLLGAGWSIVTGYPEAPTHVTGLDRSGRGAVRHILCPLHRPIAPARMPDHRNAID